MKQNMGLADRTIRVIVAALIGFLYYTQVIDGTLGIILVSLAVVFVVTSFVSFCPLYFLVGLSTKGKNQADEKPKTA